MVYNFIIEYVDWILFLFGFIVFLFVKFERIDLVILLLSVCWVKIVCIFFLDFLVKIDWKWLILVCEGCSLVLEIDLLNKWVIILFVVCGVLILSEIIMVVNSIIGIMFECVILYVFLSFSN